MADSCNHDCGSCGQSCGDRQSKAIFLQQLNPLSSVKNVIGVVSGKGGVGKSSVTVMLANSFAKKGLKVAILDADITGPSIPKAYGIKERAQVEGDYLRPIVTENGIQIMSINLLLDHETDPVIWRGPVVAGVVKQFWTDVIWSDVDVMLVDMPPGTGDVPLTVFQSLPLNGLVIVTSPQSLVSMIVGKAVSMAEQMDIPVLGMIENYSYLKCPDCDKEIPVFGESRLDEVSSEYGIEHTVRLPIDPNFAAAFDAGQVMQGSFAPSDLIEKDFAESILHSIEI